MEEEIKSVPEENIDVSKENKSEKIGFLPYVLGGLSFIPLIGILFGIISIVLGFVYLGKRGWRLIALGSCGILFTIIIYSALFYFGFVQRGGVYDKLRTEMAKEQLKNVVTSIEYFKIQNGRYPNSLSELAEKSSDKYLFVTDPTDVSLKSEGPRQYYYEEFNDGKNYYLFSIGPDTRAFTEDDILPKISEKEAGNIGYRIRPII